MEELKERVPINDYESLRPWITRQIRQGGRVISPTSPVVYYLTSGTTGEPKYVPAVRRTLRWNRVAQMLTGWGILQSRPKMLDGKILGITGSPCESYTRRGVPVGSKSGLVGANLNPLIRSKYVVPPCVFGVHDCSVKYLLILRLALNEENITYVQTANTSTVVILSDLLNKHWDRLVADVAQGGFHRWDELSADIQEEVLPLLAPRPSRAEALHQAMRQCRRADEYGTERIRLKDVFPYIQAVGCWTAGSCGIFLKRVQAEIPQTALIRDIGYIASELHGTVPIDGDGTGAIPFFDHVVYEFVSREAWERGERETIGLQQLRDGEQYYVFVTTADGLVRYHLNDIVQVNGFFNQVPRLGFVQKGSGMTNITGEKLSEFQVIEAVHRLERQQDLCSTFFMMIADEMDCRYRFYYEPAEGKRAYCQENIKQYADALDRHLADLNIEYAAKRGSDRLKFPAFCVVEPGTFKRFKQDWVARGRREGQFKIIALRYLRDAEFDFEEHVLFRSEDHWPERVAQGR